MSATAAAHAPRTTAQEDTARLLDGETHRSGDPYALWARLREQEPVLWHGPGEFPGFWSLTRYDEIDEVLRDARTYSSASGILLRPRAQGDDPGGNRTLALSEPERHRVLRGAVAGWFAPRNLRRLSDALDAQAERIVRDAVAAGRTDFVTGIAAVLPVEVVCTFLGIPERDRPDIVEWTTDAFCAGTATERTLAHLQILDYFGELAERRRAQPGDDLVSVLAAVHVDGRPLPVEDVVLNCDNLLVGGTENVRLAMSGGMLALLERPAQWELLRTGFEEVAGTAIEEILRWTSSATHLVRRAARDAVLGGRQVREGDLVVCWLPSANRDPAHFADPDAFDIRRTPNRHLALGAGPHYCVGSQLAKLEIRAVLREFVRQVRGVEPDGPPERLDSVVVGGLRTLPLRLTG
ncbi:cytochrome P450 [Streptomyces sp. 2P-4]|uniref:cytochrome P450 n=1 Tax=Streptomyces sp. 2P-4 TaxID=2931974 RepID=UPI002541C016|nr:cytochrome P450 [Streptomyces sp. 2P-4]